MSTQVSPILLRKINERRVLELIQQDGPQSRADVRRAAGMSAPTVSKAVASLLELGLLEEQEDAEPGLGRPAKLLFMASKSASVLGIVIDHPRCWVIAAGLDGEIQTENMRSFAFPSTYSELIKTLSDFAQELIALQKGTVHGVGISVPGLVNSIWNEVVFSPNFHLLNGRRLDQDLGKNLGIECRMFQESHALCLGEQMFGAAKGRDNFAMLDVGTGLGLGVMSGGRILSGHSGLAGELGHITVVLNGLPCGCGNTGCLETVSTDSALTRLISQKIGRTIDTDETIQKLRDGTVDGDEELSMTCEYLAIAVAAVINIFNPSSLFIHSRLFEVGDHVFPLMQARVQQRTLKPSLADCLVLQAKGNKRQGAVASIIHHLTDSWAPAVP